MGFRSFFGGLVSLCAWFAVFVGAISFLFGLSDIFSTQRFLWTALKTEATVIRIEEKTSEHNLLYKPTLLTSADDGQKIEYVGNTWVYPMPHKHGEVVKAFYEPKTGVIISELMFRHEARFSTFRAKFGATYLLFGAVLLWWRKRRRLRAN
ncbi:MAG: hypothetical protein JKY94_12785 [Rhodobacteraceae bacterium]|nr:hypothetical protein [Paracoccaceae bacterium]